MPRANQQILIGGAVVFKDQRGKRQFLLVKQKKDEGWEVPKITVRRGESSVRAVLRMTAEQAGMSVRVLEEAGRSSGVAAVNGKTIPQKFYYYLMMQKSGGKDIIGFDEFNWFEYGEAVKNLSLKKEKEILKSAKEVLRQWEKTQQK